MPGEVIKGEIETGGRNAICQIPANTGNLQFYRPRHNQNLQTCVISSRFSLLNVMDNLNPNSDNGVENLVRRILTSVRDMHNLGAVNTNETNGQARSGAERGAGMITPASPSEQEVNHRFRIPQTLNETRSETNEAEHDSSTVNSGQLMAQQYNPSQNYGYGNSSRRIRQP